MSLYYKTNQMQQLRGFYYTAQLKSITLAAKFMNLTQPSVTLQVRSLEDKLGLKLFYRHANKMELTHDGEKIFSKAAAIIDQVDDIYINYPLHKDKEVKELHIVANHGSLSYILPNIVKQFNESDETHYIKMHYATKEKGLEMLSKGKADIFFTPKNLDLPEEFEYTHLNSYEVNLITHNDHPLAKKQNITLSDLTGYSLAMPSNDLNIVSNYKEILAKNNSRVESRLEFSNWEMVKEYVRAGVVISLVANMIYTDDDDLFAYPMSEFFDDVSYGFIVDKKSEKSPLLEKLIKITKQLYKV